MDFDHLAEKVSNVSRLIGGVSEKLAAELGKCHLVCANCHRVRTFTRVRPETRDPQRLVEKFQSLMTITPTPVDHRFNEFPLPHLLGVVPDKELAAQTGVSRGMVAYFRRKAGIVLDRQGERISV